MLQGIAQSFGEAVVLGFTKGVPNGLVGDFSAGTGFAGVFATGVLLGARTIHLENYLLFFIECPTVILYYVSFKWLITQKKKYKFIKDTPSVPIKVEEFNSPEGIKVENRV